MRIRGRTRRASGVRTREPARDASSTGPPYDLSALLRDVRATRPVAGEGRRTSSSAGGGEGTPGTGGPGGASADGSTGGVQAERGRHGEGAARARRTCWRAGEAARDGHVLPGGRPDASRRGAAWDRGGCRGRVSRDWRWHDLLRAAGRRPDRRLDRREAASTSLPAASPPQASGPKRAGRRTAHPGRPGADCDHAAATVNTDDACDDDPGAAASCAAG